MRPRCASLNPAPPLPKYIRTHVKCRLRLVHWNVAAHRRDSSTRDGVCAPASWVTAASNAASQPAAVGPRSLTGQTPSPGTPGDAGLRLPVHLEEHVLISPVGPAATEAR